MYKIALVEDEKNLNSLVVKYLTSEGYEVVSFTTGEDAKKAISNDISLWILDIMLPGVVTGYDLLKEIMLKIKNLLNRCYASITEKDTSTEKFN